MGFTWALSLHITKLVASDLKIEISVCRESSAEGRPTRRWPIARATGRGVRAGTSPQLQKGGLSDSS